MATRGNNFRPAQVPELAQDVKHIYIYIYICIWCYRKDLPLKSDTVQRHVPKFWLLTPWCTAAAWSRCEIVAKGCLV